MDAMLRKLLLLAGLACFAVAALESFVASWDVSISTVLGLIAAGLACWIAAALP